MALNQSFIGRTYRIPWIYEVGRENIRELAYAISDLHPAFRDPEAAKSLGHPDVIAPPTFTTVLAVRTTHLFTDDPELGLDYSRMMQGSQRIINHRPIVPGDRLVCVVHVDDVYARAGNDYLTIRSEMATEDGEPVTTTVATLIARGTAVPAEAVAEEEQA